MTKPAMPEGTRQRALAAIATHRERFAPPSFDLRGEPDKWTFDCPFQETDRDHWQALIYEALGTRSMSVGHTFLNQLSAMCGRLHDGEHWKPDVDELNTAVAICAGAAPENEAQACLAVQMVALHFTGMKLAELCGRSCYPDERTVATLARVAKTYANLARTLAQLQGKGSANRQDIHVHYHKHDEQHVHLGGAGEIGAQPHAVREIVGEYSKHAGRTALRSPCPHNGEPVSIASSQRQAGVQDAWWGKRVWSALRDG